MFLLTCILNVVELHEDMIVQEGDILIPVRWRLLFLKCDYVIVMKRGNITFYDFPKKNAF